MGAFDTMEARMSHTRFTAFTAAWREFWQGYWQSPHSC